MERIGTVRRNVPSSGFRRQIILNGFVLFFDCSCNVLLIGWVPPLMTSSSTGESRIAASAAGLSTDFRHAFRLIGKSKGMSAITLLTLALCIGATTAIFSTVYSLMLKPLPFAEPEQIVEL